MSNLPALTIYYSHDEPDLKQHKAIAEGNEIKVITKNIQEEKLTSRQLFLLSTNYKEGLMGLIDKNSKNYKENLENVELDQDDLLSFLVSNPKTLKQPIVEYQNEVNICKNPRDILKFSSITPKINGYDHAKNLK